MTKLIDPIDCAATRGAAKQAAESHKSMLPTAEADRVTEGDELRSKIVPCTYGYQYHNGVRYDGGREVSGSRPISSFPVYDQKTVDMLLAEIERLASTSSTRLPVGWRDIESAPKDGNPILLATKPYTDLGDINTDFKPVDHPARCAIGRWHAEGSSWCDEYGRFPDDPEVNDDTINLHVTGVWYSGGGWFQPNEVTHWIPLPTPPGVQSAPPPSPSQGAERVAEILRRTFGVDDIQANGCADRILTALAEPSDTKRGERELTALRSNLREAWSALALIRETIETLGPVGAVPASEHLPGPTFMHEAEALIKGIQSLATPISVKPDTKVEDAVAAERKRCLAIARNNYGLMYTTDRNKTIARNVAGQIAEAIESGFDDAALSDQGER